MGFRIGLKGKLTGMVLMVIATFMIGGSQIYRIYHQLKNSSAAANTAVEQLGQIKDMQQLILDANLLGMDIIVDRAEAPNSRKVAREGEYGELKTHISQKRTALADEISDEAFRKKILISADTTEKLSSAIGVLIEAIKRGEKNPEVYSQADEDIDGAQEEGSKFLGELRTEAEAIFKESDATLNRLFNDMLYAIAATFATTIGLLTFLGLPLIFSVSSAIARLNNQLGDVSKLVSDTSNNLATISSALADSSTESAAAIQESVSAMTEMGAMLSQTTRNSSSTAGLSKSALSDTEIGVRTIEELAMSMRAISESSNRLKEINRIIDDISTKTKVINDVVFKTQLLAVNASIEATRAGQHGKGFSVVANEVASLAAMSGKASNEINELLRNSSMKVEEIIHGTSDSVKSGERVTERTSSAFNKIAQSISEISDKVDEINAATKEQEAGIAQTSTALIEMNKSTRTNSDMARKNAAISRDLNNLATSLSRIKSGLEKIVAGGTVETTPKTDRTISANESNSDSAQADFRELPEQTGADSEQAVSLVSLAKSIRDEGQSSESRDQAA